MEQKNINLKELSKCILSFRKQNKKQSNGIPHKYHKKLILQNKNMIKSIVVNIAWDVFKIDLHIEDIPEKLVVSYLKNKFERFDMRRFDDTNQTKILEILFVDWIVKILYFKKQELISFHQYNPQTKRGGMLFEVSDNISNIYKIQKSSIILFHQKAKLISNILSKYHKQQENPKQSFKLNKNEQLLVGRKRASYSLLLKKINNNFKAVQLL